MENQPTPPATGGNQITDAGPTTAVMEPPVTTELPDASGPPSIDVAGMHIEAEEGAGLKVTKSAPFKSPEGLLILSGQLVEYLFDDDGGRPRGADVQMWRHAPDGSSTQLYKARIRREAGLFRWYEPDAESEDGWKSAERGQHVTMLQPIVEQAIEYATSRVFGTWP